MYGLRRNILIIFTTFQTVVAGHLVLSPRTLSRQVPTFTGAVAKNTSSPNSNYGSGGSDLLMNTGSGSLPSIPIGTITTGPLWAGDFQNSESAPANARTCDVTDAFCPFTGSVKYMDGPTITGLGDQCMLWDSLCKGNITLAYEQWFDETQNRITRNDCFIASASSQSQDCIKSNPPGRMAEFTAIKNWMRGTDCPAERLHTPDSKATTLGLPQEPIDGGGTCCGPCFLYANNVDVYYWPKPDANTSCLGIIGTSILPIDYGATTNPAGGIYWGCTTEAPPGSTSILTTATLQIIDGTISVKQALENPWSLPPCSNPEPPSSMQEGYEGFLHMSTITLAGGEVIVDKRGHSLIIPTLSVPGSPLISTLVSAGYTFTSPSVYAMFQSLVAGDACGETSIASTMLSFAPGELSTLGGHFGEAGQLTTTKPFDTGDLPCPPMSVMEENWWKPEPGLPYRPLIALPQQIIGMASWWPYCSAGLFTGYDPPRTLVPAAAMVPTITSSVQAGPAIVSPAASPTLDSGPQHTAANPDGISSLLLAPEPMPAYTQAGPGPNTISSPVPNLQQTGPGGDFSGGSTTSESDAVSSPQIGGGGDPGQGSDPSQASRLGNANSGGGNESPVQGSNTNQEDGPVQSEIRISGTDPGGVSGADSPPNQASPQQSSTDGQVTQKGSDPSLSQPSQQEGDPQGASANSGKAPLGNGGYNDPTSVSPAQVQAATASPIQSDDPSQDNTPNLGAIILSAMGGGPVTANSLAPSSPSAHSPANNGANIPNIPAGISPVDPAQPPVETIGHMVFTADSSSDFLIGGFTVGPEVPAVAATNAPANSPVGATAAVVGGDTAAITGLKNAPEPSQAAAPVFSFAGSAYTPDSSSNFVIGSQTLVPGGIPITVSNTPISLAAGATQAIVGSNAVPITPPLLANTALAANIPILAFGGSTYSANSLSQFEIESQTLSPGAAITISGTPISLAPDAPQAVVGSSTIPIFPAANAASAGSAQVSALPFAGTTYSANSNSYFIIGSPTLAPSAAITVSGTAISLVSGSSAAILGSTTQVPTTDSPTIITVLNLGGSLYTAGSSSAFVIGSQTLTPGGALVVSETAISYPASGSAIMVGTKSTPLSFATIIGAGTSPANLTIAFGGSIYTADSSSNFVINGQTVAPSGIIPDSGLPVSYAVAGTAVVVGSSTEATGVNGGAGLGGSIGGTIYSNGVPGSTSPPPPTGSPITKNSALSRGGAPLMAWMMALLVVLLALV